MCPLFLRFHVLGEPVLCRDWSHLEMILYLFFLPQNILPSNILLKKFSLGKWLFPKVDPAVFLHSKTLSVPVENSLMIKDSLD